MTKFVGQERLTIATKIHVLPAGEKKILSAFLRERELDNDLEWWCLLHSKFPFLLLLCSRMLLLLRGGKKFQKPCSAIFPYFVILSFLLLLGIFKHWFSSHSSHAQLRSQQSCFYQACTEFIYAKETYLHFVFLGRLKQFYLHLCRNV